MELLGNKSMLMLWDLHSWVLLWDSLWGPSESLKNQTLVVELIRNINLSFFAGAGN